MTADAVDVTADLLEHRRELALRRLPWAWTEDRAEYESAVSAPPLRAIAERWVPSRGGLLVLGRTGAGKTASVVRALRRIVRAATDYRDPVLRLRWTTATELVRARTEHRLGQGEPDVIREARSAPVLVIDEIGFERADEALWTDLIHERYQKQSVTLATSGRDADAFALRYGSATMRKLTDPRGALLDLWGDRK